MISPRKTIGPLQVPSAIVLLVLFSNVVQGPSVAVAGEYEDFEAFARAVYGAEHDPLIYTWFGQDLQAPVDRWEYVSESSAVIGFATNLPAESFIEYGESPSYGLQTSPTDRKYYQHLHFLTGLTPGARVHYRIVVQDERGNVVEGPHRTVLPAALSQAIRIPDDIPGPPYVLDTPSAHYLVTQDIDAPRTAFEIAADGVTLDLGGHTVTYNNESQIITGEWWIYRNEAAFGVRSMDFVGFGVHNGVLRQGVAQNGGHPDAAIGFNPIYVLTASDFEVSGMVLEYGGAQLVGLYAHWPSGSNEIHDNVFVDKGTVVTNRHGMGCRSFGITGTYGSFHTHHNLVKRTRHTGLDGGLIHDNEIYVDSFATNSFGIPALGDDREAFANKIFGTGYHVVGIGWGRNNWWHDNFIHLVGQGPDFRYAEYGNQESLNGFRLTQYAGGTFDLSDSIVEHNLVIVSGGGCATDGECTQTRGLQYHADPYVVNNVIRDNTIKVVMSPVITQAAAIVTQGLFSRCGLEAPVVYSGNTLISNVANVRMGDYAGAGCNHQFLGNEMVREGNRSDYRSLKFDQPVATVGHFFCDSTFSGGAQYDLVEFTDPGQELGVGWTLTVVATDGTNPIAGATVTVDDSSGTTVATGSTDALGSFSERILAYQETSAGRTHYTPHEVFVAYESLQESTTVVMDAPQQVTMVLLDPTAGPPANFRGALTLSAAPSVMSHQTRLWWRQSLEGTGTLDFFDMRGRRVRSVALPPGATQTTWDGRDGAGRPVGSGVYLARLRSGGSSAVCRVLVLR